MYFLVRYPFKGSFRLGDPLSARDCKRFRVEPGSSKGFAPTTTLLDRTPIFQQYRTKIQDNKTSQKYILLG